MATVLIVTHQHREEAARLAGEAVAWLGAAGHKVALPEDDATLLGRPELGVERVGPGHVDLALSIGGDGTMLRTVDLVAQHGVPVLGVNVGQLGYLVEIEPPGWRQAVERFFAGLHHIEERMMLHVSVDGGPSGAALNEAVLEKTPLGHTVRLRVSIDGEPFTYTADGFIIATPTGSTAYALSARAPIVAPTHRALVLTPVAPHMLFDRSLVLDPTTAVRIEVASYRPARLFLDGRELATLTEGMGLRCTALDQPARLVTFAPRNFLGILKSKFGLNDR